MLLTYYAVTVVIKLFHNLFQTKSVQWLQQHVRLPIESHDAHTQHNYIYNTWQHLSLVKLPCA